MSILNFFVPLGVTGVAYMILALQLSSGFPPFYIKSSPSKWSLFTPRKEPAYEAVKIAIPFIFGIIGTMVLIALTEQTVFILLMGILSIWCGFQLRQTLFKQTNGPLPWVENFLTPRLPYAAIWIQKWPMLIFDIWTMGFCLPFILIMSL